MQFTLTWSHGNWCIMDGFILVDYHPCYDNAVTLLNKLNGV